MKDESITDEVKQNVEKARDLLSEVLKYLLTASDHESVRLFGKRFPNQRQFDDDRFDLGFSLNCSMLQVEDCIRYLDHHILND